MKSIHTIIVTFGFIPLNLAWIPQPLLQNSLSRKGSADLFATEESSESESFTTDTNPCWQDLYDDDCSMSTIYASSFVAKDWIKSLPCANGLEVSIWILDEDTNHFHLIWVFFFIQKFFSHVSLNPFFHYSITHVTLFLSLGLWYARRFETTQFVSRWSGICGCYGNVGIVTSQRNQISRKMKLLETPYRHIDTANFQSLR